MAVGGPRGPGLGRIESVQALGEGAALYGGRHAIV